MKKDDVHMHWPALHAAAHTSWKQAGQSAVWLFHNALKQGATKNWMQCGRRKISHNRMSVFTGCMLG